MSLVKYLFQLRKTHSLNMVISAASLLTVTTKLNIILSETNLINLLYEQHLSKEN